jgi:hypothetical protein
MTVRDAGAGVEPRHAGVDAIDERERHVARVAGEHVRCGTVDGGFAVGALAAVGQVAQRAQPPFADDLLGGLDHRAKNAADPSVLVVDRAVRERKIGFLRITLAIDVQQQVTRAGGLPAAHHLREHRPDHVPDLGPHPRPALTERMRILLRPEDGAVLVVVEDRQLGPPPDDDRERAIEADAHRRAQRLRPLGHGPEHRLRPVELSHPLGHHTAAGDDLVEHPQISSWRRVRRGLLAGWRGG